MAGFPHDGAIDSTLALWRDGYTFVRKRCSRLETDVFETRLMFRPAVCALGEDAARTFYHPGRFTRKRAMPPTALKLLQDKGSVQLLDGKAHRHRKELFMSIMTAGSVGELVRAFAHEWQEAVERWTHREEVVLHDDVREILCRAACRWAGIPLEEGEVRKRTHEFAAMVDGAGAVGPRNWRGQVLRARSERWMRGVVEAIRAGELNAEEGGPAHAIATYRGQDGDRLDVEAAAVELTNLLRPTVAVANFITFAALALHEHSETRPNVHDEAYLEAFAQEVRRFYPFFPLIAGLVLNPFEWRERRFETGDWFLLDLYGTNHDARTWDEPLAFRPERFLDREITPFDLVPQGGGSYAEGHRCPGEDATIELIKTAVRMLTAHMRYDLPKQDLSIDLSRMPALPKSRVVIRNVRSVG